jgi:hypothetical protein
MIRVSLMGDDGTFYRINCILEGSVIIFSSTSMDARSVFILLATRVVLGAIMGSSYTSERISDPAYDTN